VQVYAKGKGKRSARQTMLPQTGPQQMTRGPPPIDPDNEEFVIFIRPTSGPIQQWMSVSVVKGGSQANTLVAAMQQSEWGKALYSRTLISNIGQSLYKERDAMVKSIRKSAADAVKMGMKSQEPIVNVPTKDWQFAFKIRDKSDAADASRATNLTIIPPEDQITLNPIDNFKKFFSSASA